MSQPKGPELRERSVREIDIDIAMSMIFEAYGIFSSWFAARMGIRTDTVSCGQSIRSLHVGTGMKRGETDIVLLLHGDGADNTHLIHIENKILAPFLPRQAEEYGNRALAHGKALGVHAGNCHTCLIAPSCYLDKKDEVGFFDAAISYEKIAAQLKTMPGVCAILGARMEQAVRESAQVMMPRAKPQKPERDEEESRSRIMASVPMKGAWIRPKNMSQDDKKTVEALVRERHLVRADPRARVYLRGPKATTPSPASAADLEAVLRMLNPLLMVALTSLNQKYILRELSHNVRRSGHFDADMKLTIKGSAKMKIWNLILRHYGLTIPRDHPHLYWDTRNGYNPRSGSMIVVEKLLQRVSECNETTSLAA